MTYALSEAWSPVSDDHSERAGQGDGQHAPCDEAVRYLDVRVMDVEAAERPHPERHHHCKIGTGHYFTSGMRKKVSVILRR